MNSVRPPYYKVLWHKCNRCFTHYTSEEPHLRAYLCDECWNAVPHFTVKTQKKVTTKKNDINIQTIILYTIGNLLCLGVIAYYLWFK
jgi:hypothetical protein